MAFYQTANSRPEWGRGDALPISCVWCGSSTVAEVPVNHQSRVDLPAAFCWTKMHAEAGQPLQLILHRKELERIAGRGLFFWGIGTSVTRRVIDLLRRVARPKVVFSVMKGKPRQEDVSPSGVLLWTTYSDLDGEMHRLPDHALVLSRASTQTGKKTRHYALACYSDRALQLEPRGELQLGHFRNLGSDSQRVGHSQVTAVIEHKAAPSNGPSYNVDLVADLAHPFFVQLGNPVLLRSAEKKRIDSTIPQLADAQDWTILVRDVKHRVGLC